ncbi:MAG: DUF3800 domain-containing protein [Terriglobales bacterium]
MSCDESQYLSIRLCGQLLMGFFHSFFDESGKFKDHKVVSFCGIVTENGNLRRFTEAWKVLLRHYEMPFLHMKRALNPNVALGPAILKQTIPERNDALKPFADCIADNLELGVAMAVDVEGFSKWEPGAKKRLGGSDDPAYLAFLRVGSTLQEYAARDDDQISLTCDDDLGTAWNFYQLYRRVRVIDPIARKKFIAIAFANDKHYPALQAADMLSSLVRLEAYRQFSKRPYDFIPLFKHLTQDRGPQAIKWRVMFANKAVLENLAKNLSTLK